MTTPLVSAIRAAAILFIWSATPLPAHEGHDHGGAVPAPTASAARGEATSGSIELVALARNDTLMIYIDDFTTNSPIERASVDVETPTGAATVTAVEGGPYVLAAPWLSKPGRYDLIFTVVAGTATEILPVTLVIPEPSSPVIPSASNNTLNWLIAGVVGFALGIGVTMLVRRQLAMAAILTTAALLAHTDGQAHEGHDHSKDALSTPNVVRERAQRLDDGTLFVPKDTQRIFAVRTVLTESQRHRRSVELPARVIADPNASGLVQASIAGRLSPPPSGMFPRLGTAVQKGEVLAYVTPPLQAIEVSDMRQRQGELDQQLAIVQRRVNRLSTLVTTGAASRVQLEEATLELEGLNERRAQLERSKAQPEALTAPVAGTIADGTPVAGQMAQTNAVVFNIIDPARLWIEALSFDVIGGPQTQATAKRPDGQPLVLKYQGAGLADRNQTLPIHFSIEGKPEGLRIGQFLAVHVVTGGEKTGVALPKASVVRSSNGQDFVFEHVSPERFLARPVRVEPLDGDRVLVLAGIDPGKRIVVQGAELLDHVR